MTEQIENWLMGGPRLLNVIPIAERFKVPGDLPNTAISLDLWEDCIRFSYMLTTMKRPDTPVDPQVVFAAWSFDDGMGTRFTWGGGGGTGDGMRQFIADSWRPRPAKDATSLRISNPRLGLDITVDLPER